MSGQLSDYELEVRDEIIKSSFTGVGLTVLAVAMFSPAGFGGMVGASLASGLGFDTNAAAVDNPYANLPAYPTPLTQAELSHIRGQLASTSALLEITRAATDDKIEHVRSLALSDGMVTFTPTLRTAAPAETNGLRLTLSESIALAVPEAPVEAYVIETAPVQASVAPASYAPASYSGGGYDASVPYRDPHLELADLLLAHETF